jgi:hypothetical protein
MTRSSRRVLGATAALAVAAVLAPGCRRPSSCPEGHDERPGKLPGTIWCQQRGGNKALLIQLFDTGQRRQTCAYVGGVPDGPFEGWHRNGKTWLKGSYVAGKPDGNWVQMDEQGVKVAEGEYRSSRLIQGAPVAIGALCESGKP